MRTGEYAELREAPDLVPLRLAFEQSGLLEGARDENVPNHVLLEANGHPRVHGPDEPGTRQVARAGSGNPRHRGQGADPAAPRGAGSRSDGEGPDVN